jgi:catechol 2,3-dioxygenase-like lactoylglutathione lyase family enzyme
MAFHHVAIATRDLETTHRFYTEAMGFELVKTVAAPTPDGGNGWARHLFYDTGNGEMFAIWDLHDAEHIPSDFSPAISTGLGLPSWVNHIAFAADDLDDIARRRDRWLANGYDVLEIDHGWCTSIYCDDPNGIAVEFCTTTATFTTADRDEADARLRATKPALDEEVPNAIAYAAADYQPAAVS